MRPPGWAEGALEVFGLGESSSRNVALEVKKARQAKTRRLDIPTSVVEEDGSPLSPTSVPAGAGAEASVNDGKDFPLADTDKSTSQPASAGLQAFPTAHSSTSQVDLVNNAKQRPRASQTHSFSSQVAYGDEEDSTDDETAQDGAPGSRGYRRIHRRTQSNASRQSAAERLNRITASLDFANNSKVKGEITAAALEALKRAAKEGAPSVQPENYDVTEFEPYVFHKPHLPVPMALVNRRPHGTPGHSDIRNPQCAAWLAGCRYAKEHVFIQSPTLNAMPIKQAVLGAVKRHVRVELWLDLGFNDKSESMPFQGGTNEQVVTWLYRQLRKEGKGNEKYLEVFWYTGKDMTRPLNAVRKQRNW